MNRAGTVDGPSRDSFIAALRTGGLRATVVRLAVLATLRRQPHADTETVINGVRAELGTVSNQAVYNVLAALVAAELARRVEPAGSVALDELRVGDNHHHVVCRACGTVADVDCAVHRAPCLTPSETHGFLLDEAEVTYWGICPHCQATAASTPRPAATLPGGGEAEQLGDRPKDGAMTGELPAAAADPGSPATTALAAHPDGSHQILEGTARQ